MMNHTARLLLWALLLVALAATYSIALAAGWVVAPGPATEVCETAYREPEARMGPNGLWYYIPPPICRQVQTGKAPLYHRDGRQMIPAQQSVPQGSACLYTITIDHYTYGQTAEGGSLWALCTPR